MKRLLAALGFALPPLAFFAWLLWTVAGQTRCGDSRFWSRRAYLAALRWSLFAKMALGERSLPDGPAVGPTSAGAGTKKIPAQRGYSRGAKVASPGRS